MSVFTVAFSVASCLTFLLLDGAGHLLAQAVPARTIWWATLAVAAALLVHELATARRKGYCALSWRRQTPKRVMMLGQHHLIALVWGVDTGLGFTTYRVTNGWWLLAALVVAGHAGPLVAGLGVGLTFTATLWLVLTGRGEQARERPGDLRRSVPAVHRAALLLEALVVVLLLATW